MTDIISSLTQGIQSGNFEYIMLLAAFLGGVLASLSPCSIAMLPIIIGYVGGYSKETPIRTFLQMLIFILGTSIVFSVIGVACVVTGKVFVSVAGAYFTIILASLLLVLGLKLLNVLDFEFPTFVKSMPQNNANSLFLYPLLLGMVFAVAGTPCSTPILAAIMTFAVLTKSIMIAALMLFLFALGQGTILIVAGVFTSGLKGLKNFAKISEILLGLSGALLVVTSLYIFYKIFSMVL